jgi:4-hydroxy-tetrahydrodipicolinate reductase
MSTGRPIRICIAGATSWAGSAVTQRILRSGNFHLAGVIARQSVGRDIGEVLGEPAAGITVVSTMEDALPAQPDVLIDYTTPDSVKARIHRLGLATGLKHDDVARRFVHGR